MNTIFPISTLESVAKLNDLTEPLPVGVKISLLLGYSVVPWALSMLVAALRGWRRGWMMGYLVAVGFSVSFELLLPSMFYAVGSKALAWCEGTRTMATLAVGWVPALVAALLGSAMGSLWRSRSTGQPENANHKRRSGE